MGTRKRIAVSVRSCGICTQELPPTDYMLRGTTKDKDVVQLSCKHLFHTFCVRGAALLNCPSDICHLASRSKIANSQIIASRQPFSGFSAYIGSRRAMHLPSSKEF